MEDRNFMNENERKRIPTEVSVPNRANLKGRIPTMITVADSGKVKNLPVKTEQPKKFDTLTDYIRQIASAPFKGTGELRDAVQMAGGFTGFSGASYQIEGVLSDQGGESVVFLCTDEKGQKSAAKVYLKLEERYGSDRNALAKLSRDRNTVIEFTRRPGADRYVLPIHDVAVISLMPGYCNYIEIQPYCEGGDLSRHDAMSYEELRPVILHLNEGLHYIHEGGLLHMDIKPENLYYYKDAVVIGDFGVAHRQENNTRKTRFSGGTIGYRSPEACMNSGGGYILTSASDYYSLGVTIASLYAGCYIYDKIGGDVAALMFDSYLPLPGPESAGKKYLQNLINGLYQMDKNARFGYEDIRRWAENPEYGKQTGTDGWPVKYNFYGTKCKDTLELFEAFSKDWQRAKAHLYDGSVKVFFGEKDPSLANAAHRIVELEYPSNGMDGKDDMGLFRFLTVLHPDGPFVWMGRVFHSLKELGEKLAVTTTPEGYGDMLAKGLVSMWLSGKNVSEEVESAVKKIEKTALVKPVLACAWFGYTFSGKKEISFDGKIFENLKQFVSYVLSSPTHFYEKDGIVETMGQEEKCISLYGCLFSRGFRQQIDSFREMFTMENKRESALGALYLLENVVSHELPEMVGEIRRFFKEFGPMGYLCYVQELIASGEVYYALAPSEEKLLEEIAKMPVFEDDSIADMTVDFQKLEKKVDRMLMLMQNNPFLLEAGMMEGKTIGCRKLAGFFCMDFLGTMVPLGYETSWRMKEEGLL